MKTMIYSLAIGASLIGAAAQAQDAMDGPRGMGRMPDFATLDADSDGLVTRDEITAAATARFATADADADGALSVEEMVAQAIAEMEADRAARATEFAQRMLDRVDDNGDGLIQFEELEARAPRPANMIDRVDTDGDGAINADEYATAQARMLDRMGGGDGEGMRDGHGGGHHGDRDGHGNHGDRDGHGHGNRG